MKIGIYYGGRGVVDDPTLFVLEKMEQVLEELNVETFRYNIYAHKQEISILSQTLNGLDGIILATTVEWNGIGGFMHEFLDACWFYGNKEEIATIYMQPVVMSTTYGEREGMMDLENAWEILGGLPCSGLCGYVEDMVEFRMNETYLDFIDKKAQDLYRTISRKLTGLPTSNQAVTRKVLRTQQISMTPQESEIASEIASDDNKVRQQKEDVRELSKMYQSLLSGAPIDEGMNEFLADFRKHFHPQRDFEAGYQFAIQGKKEPLYIGIKENELVCEYADHVTADVHIQMDRDIMIEIVAGRKTFQRAFATGEMSARGNFMNIRMLDEIFPFSEETGV